MRTLVLNAGSTTLKLAVVDGGRELAAETVEGRPPADAVADGVAALRGRGLLPVDAVGHRVVHGGSAFREAVRVDWDVRERLAALAELAPLHNPPALAALDEAVRLLPDVPHVAAFDTAFHATLPREAFTYPVPAEWTDAWGVRKYGFHGLSHSFCSSRAAEMLGRAGDPDVRVIVAHLGGGCSLSAVRGGVCRDTTMGFTPLDGLMMATRCGSVDAGAVLHVLRHHGLSADDADDVLNHKSGLLGVSGVSGDVRKVRAAADAGDGRAAFALSLFAYRLRLGIGQMAAALGGVDALVFTAGIGENDAKLRRAVCDELGFLGLTLDAARNATAAPDADVSPPGAAARVLVVRTHEELAIAREVARVVGSK